MTVHSPLPLSIYICSAQEDSIMCNILNTHLEIVRRNGWIKTWCDSDLSLGVSIDEERERQLRAAHIALLLLSPDFFVSESCNSQMVKALQRYYEGELVVIPIILRPVDWKITPLTPLKALALPKNQKPITSWANVDEAFFATEQGIREVLVDKLRTEKYPEGPVFFNLESELDDKKSVFFLPFDLPELFVERPLQMEQLRKALIGKQENIALTAAVHGMGGLGKTVLARALCDDPIIRSAFPDGILWATIGLNPKQNETHPRLPEIQSSWISVLKGDTSATSSLNLGKVELQSLLAERAMLVILDDVWNQKDIECLRVAGPRSRTLITTRDSTVAGSATLVRLEVMSSEECRELLRTASSGILKDAKVADIIAERLGYLPLAVDIVARLLKEDITWEEIETALNSNIKNIEYGDQTLATIAASISFLNPDDIKRYYELIVFPPDEKLGKGTVARLWKYAGLDSSRTSLLLAKFRQRALLQEGNTLHDILYSYLQNVVKTDTQCELHNLLIDAYGGPDGWQTFPDSDEFYIWRNIGYHLSKARRLSDLHALITNGSYIQAKLQCLGAGEVLTDYTYFSNNDRLQLVVGGLQLGAQVLNREPSQLRNQIFGRLGTLEDLHNLPLKTEPFFNLDSRTLTHPDASPLSSFKGHKGSVFSCTFSPNGKQILSASADSSLRLWNIDTNITIFTFEGHSGAVNDCAITQDGQAIISASDDTTLRIWNISSKDVAEILQGHTGNVKSCSLSPNGKIILSASSDMTLRLWNMSDGKCFQILRGHQAGVNCCCFHSNGQLVASGGDDNSVKIWDYIAGKTTSILEGHTERVLSCTFSPDGRLLASSSEDKTIRIWDVKSGKTISTLEGHTDFVHCCSFSPDGIKILSASSDYTLRLWDVATGHVEQILRGHNSWVNKCCFSEDGQLALSASYDGSLRLWDLHEFTTIKEFIGSIGYLRDCTFSKDGKLALSANADGSLQLWNAYHHVALQIFKGHSDYASSCVFNAEGNYILSTSADSSLRLWDIENGTTIRIMQGHQGNIYQCAFSPDGSLALSASYDKTLRLWDTNTGISLRTFIGHQGVVRGCAYSPDGNFILSSSWDDTLRLWDVHTEQCIFVLRGHTNHVRGCVFSPNGKYALSASYDKTLKLWKLEDGSCIHTYKGHTNWVFDCAFSPDGTMFISVADDHTLILWRTETGEIIDRWIADAPLTCCDINQDGKRVICGDSLGNLHFLHLENI